MKEAIEILRDDTLSDEEKIDHLKDLGFSLEEIIDLAFTIGWEDDEK